MRANKENQQRAFKANKKRFGCARCRRTPTVYVRVRVRVYARNSVRVGEFAFTFVCLCVCVRAYAWPSLFLTSSRLFRLRFCREVPRQHVRPDEKVEQRGRGEGQSSREAEKTGEITTEQKMAWRTLAEEECSSP